jgi:hypothetical protein
LVDIEVVLDEYIQMGYSLTLRQLYYQLVSSDRIPNKQAEYKKLGKLVSQARLAGLIDWYMIEDRVRNRSLNTHWDNPQQILDATAKSYYLDRWQNQNYHVEVWCEKDAVSNILQPVCRKWDVSFMANRGYTSQSAMWRSCQRFKYAIEDEKEIVIIYLGDHDPSGIDMVRDIIDRTELLTDGQNINTCHIALILDQINEYKPPENPAKVTDSRYETYRNKHGESCWELDALRPDVLADILEKEIMNWIDLDEFGRIEKQEAEERELLKNLIKKGGG